MGISTIEAFPAIIVVVATFFTIHARAQENAGSAPFMIRTVISQKSGAAAQGSTPWYGDLKSCEAEARRIGASLGADAVVQCIATSSGNTGSNALPGYSPGLQHEPGRAAGLCQSSPVVRKGRHAGNPRAMHNLGDLYEQGHGVARDHTKAREWFGKATHAGYIPPR